MSGVQGIGLRGHRIYFVHTLRSRTYTKALRSGYCEPRGYMAVVARHFLLAWGGVSRREDPVVIFGHVCSLTA